MYSSWAKIKKRGDLCSEWAEDFWLFIKDTDSKPESPTRPKLSKKDKTQPYSKDNFYWTVPPDKAAYQKVYRVDKGRQLRSKVLERSFGITMDDYDRMLEDQKGVCAICGLPETTRRKGTLLRLSVDHCHTTGKVRALLCGYCNPALGAFKDSPALLNKAIEYLSKHSEVSS
jgi:hypothetical protein